MELATNGTLCILWKRHCVVRVARISTSDVVTGATALTCVALAFKIDNEGMLVQNTTPQQHCVLIAKILLHSFLLLLFFNLHSSPERKQNFHSVQAG